MVSVLWEERKEEITLELIDGFLDDLDKKGRGKGSLQNYRRILTELYRYLPEEKTIGRETGMDWKTYLEEQGLQSATVNTYMSVWNSFLQYLGHREWQINAFGRKTEKVQPELSRREYLRLLSAAKQMEKEKVYLLIKTLGGAGMRIQELSQLTVDAVEQGVVELTYHNAKKRRILRLPEGLRKELLDFTRREGRTWGVVFCSQDGAPMSRTSVNYCINSVSREAQVPEEKANPRCLWKMYQETCRRIRCNVDVLVEQSYQRMMEEEQLLTGWKI
ncbi:MAG: tyrosine-type recombinase/integrase [Lachnospiraceae bacterium]|jgi:site-specific recombinase XerD|nr:tyrosine-type recombinase/integrase [uncultured Acetatifactor sp.]MCI9429142.1 tyrosine-type recombinase/integrase [Lachnospiraceae bacterium]